MYKAKFHPVAICVLANGSRIALRKPRKTLSTHWRLEGYYFSHNGYCVLNLTNGDVRYLKPETLVYIYF